MWTMLNKRKFTISSFPSFLRFKTTYRILHSQVRTVKIQQIFSPMHEFSLKKIPSTNWCPSRVWAGEQISIDTTGHFSFEKRKLFQDPWNVLVEVRPEETPSRCVVAVAVILRGKEFSEGRANYVYFLKEVKSLPLSPRLFALVVVFSSRLGQFVTRNYYKIA